jgi:uncharacterized phiE125 gp8 family phage protein
LRLVLVDGPAVEPLTVAEARARSNVGSNVSDEVVQAFITAARQTIDGADGWLGRALITQTWRGGLDEFPTCDGGRIFIPLPPLQSVTVKYLRYGDPVGLIQGIDYQLVQAPRPYIVPLTAWPAVTGVDGITIEFVAGYGNAGSDVPEPIRTAIALMTGDFCDMATRNPYITQEVEEGVGSTRYMVNADVNKMLDNALQNLLSIYRVIEI